MLKLINNDITNSDTTKPKNKKQKLVKHSKKNWSKLDISDVEKGIDNLRQEELTGGVRAEKPDKDLFYINKTDINSAESARHAKRRQTLEEKMNNLACYRNLRPDTENSLPSQTKVIIPPTPGSKRSERLKAIQTLKYKNKTFIQHDEIPKWRQTKPIVPKTQVIIKAEFNKDLWTSSELPPVDRTNEFYMIGKKLIPSKKPVNPIQTESQIPKLEMPHPGTSYNPDYDDHQDLLLKAHVIELKKLKEEEKLMRRLTVKVAKMSWEALDKLWLEEMSTNELFEEKPSEELVDVDEDESSDKKKDEISVSKRELRRRLAAETKKPNETKVKRQRRLLSEKIKKRQKENEKQIRIQQNEIFRLKSLKKQVDEEANKKNAEIKERRATEEHAKKFGTKRLNRLKYEEPELDLKLSSELTSSLRQLKPEGNIMTDRYKSLQKRNIIEPRVRARSQRKFWKKKFAKRTALEVTNFVR